MDARDARPDRHTRDGIVDTALALLEQTGLPDLSMRRLATALGVQPSALYWHFENKQELLAAVADRIVEPVTDARGDVADVAHALRGALLAHRDGAEVVLSTQALGLGSDAAHIRLALALAGDEVPGEDARGDATVILQFILGHASLVQQRIQAARFGAFPAGEAEIAEAMSADFARGLRMLLAPRPVRAGA
ncbi:TetR family transcriptional regulator [Microbacterium phosphatis]|uniref:TetR family transcriptional regulator n=1 Tax=Microbacterium phosphatis TaxID=3140248 RepID=UPI00313FF9AB